nr:cellulose synthase-like protein D5 [Tanacetum cinerariifolium]
MNLKQWELHQKLKNPRKIKLVKALIVALFFDKTSVVVVNRITIRTLRNSSAARIQITQDVEAGPHLANSQDGGGAGRYLSILKDGGGHEYVAYTVHIPPTPDHQSMDNSQDSLDTKVHEPVSGETSSRNTVIDSTTSKKRKRNQRAKKTVACDVLNAKVDEVVGGEMVLGKTVTDDTTPKEKKR